jgi:S-adenosylmethionine decarboxylase
VSFRIGDEYHNVRETLPQSVVQSRGWHKHTVASWLKHLAIFSPAEPAKSQASTKEIVVGHRAEVVFTGCAAECIHDPERLLAVLTNACEKARLSVVESVIHAFDPYGITCVIILSQSHMIGHTWPEYDALVVDLFICSTPGSIDTVTAEIQNTLQPERVTSKIHVQRV